MIYRGVAGVNVVANYGEQHQSNVVMHPWKGGAVSLGSHDFLQQQDGFKPSCTPGKDVTVLLCV